MAPIFFAAIYTALGDREVALERLERGYRERAPSMIGLHVDPWLDDLRPDPRFQDLLRRIGSP